MLYIVFTPKLQLAVTVAEPEGNDWQYYSKPPDVVRRQAANSLGIANPTYQGTYS